MKRLNGSSIVAFLILASGLTACQALQPVRSVPVELQAPLYKAPTFLPTQPSEATPTPQSQSGDLGVCTNMLQFIPPDLTYPDGTEVKAGDLIDKQWNVKNAGTCNWDASYSLKLIGGDNMAAATEQAHVPARNGTESVISIQFTAPEEPGRYYSQWKAVDPNGQVFGDMLFVDITVVKE